jgi:serine/threonine protein kinase
MDIRLRDEYTDNINIIENNNTVVNDNKTKDNENKVFDYETQSKNSVSYSQIDSQNFDNHQHLQTEEIKNEIFIEKYELMTSELDKINAKYNVKKNCDIGSIIDTFDNKMIKEFAIDTYNTLSQINDLRFELDEKKRYLFSQKRKSVIYTENLIDKVISDYVIKEKITDTSFVAVDKNTLRKYEMKMIENPNMIMYNINIKILSQITENMKQIDNNNVLKIYNIIDEKKEKKIYLITKYTEGFPLLEKKDKNSFKPLELSTIINYTKQIINGLSILHSQKLILWNFNFDNLLIFNDCIYLTNYWINNTKNKYYYNNKYKIDTLFFSPPEILINDASFGAYNNAWSLGIIIFVMIYGYLPFYGENYDELKRTILFKEPNYPINMNEIQKDFFKKIFHKDPFLRITLSQMARHQFLRFILELNFFNSLSESSLSSRDISIKPPPQKLESSISYRRSSMIDLPLKTNFQNMPPLSFRRSSLNEIPVKPPSQNDAPLSFRRFTLTKKSDEVKEINGENEVKTPQINRSRSIPIKLIDHIGTKNIV